MECESIVAPKPVISYKDMIIGGNVSPSLDESIDLDDDDIELLEEDIFVGLFDEWHLETVPPYQADGYRMYYYLVKFSDRKDYLKVLTEGPWKNFGHYITC
ncbi:hypothetical protein V6N12_076311 [Hibiscus sabdariffa]|uniref:DUF4283 domain-containing protein n=1 Tax=Hibiscus sabdariffa TaxID=183260 RepID=A0ABR2D9F2_9ROSI